MEFSKYASKRVQETWPCTTSVLRPSKKRISNLGMNGPKFQPVRILPLYVHIEESINENEEDKSDSGISNSYDNECKRSESPEYLLCNQSEELNKSEVSSDDKVFKYSYEGNDIADKCNSPIKNGDSIIDFENCILDNKYSESSYNELESETLLNGAKYYPTVKREVERLSSKLQCDSSTNENDSRHMINKTFTVPKLLSVAPYSTAYMKNNKNICLKSDISGIEPLNDDNDVIYEKPDEKPADFLNKTYIVTNYRDNSNKVLQNITDLRKPSKIRPSRYTDRNFNSISNNIGLLSYAKTDQHVQVTAETANEEVQTEIRRPESVDKQVQSLEIETFDKSVNVSLNQSTFGTETLTVNGKNYSVLSKVGQGGSSVVYQVFDPRNGLLLAVKCVSLPRYDDASAMSYLNEIKLLKRLQDSDSVIRLYDYEHSVETRTLFVVMERGDTDLSKLIRGIFRSKKKISDPMIVYYWTEILKAVKCIHDAGIIHSDLKPSNFVLVSGRLKLIDFGIAVSVQGDMTSVFKDTATGTFNYMSPESVQDICNGKDKSQYKIGYRSDVWSLGCILYNLVYGRTPFQHIQNPWAKIAAVMNPNTQIVYPATESYSPVIMDTMKKCLTFDPKKRPTVTELLQIPYISGFHSRPENL